MNQRRKSIALPASPVPMRRQETAAFTLIELSIVLVIIGLIVGGVLVGQTLIQAAGVRATISQIEKYQTAVNTFRGKFDYLPGDIPTGPAAQFGFIARGPYLGEGDGNGVIEGNVCCAYSQNSGIALEDLTEAIRLRPDFALAFCARGTVREDHDGALSDYTEAVRLRPDFVVAFCCRAALRCEKGDIEGGLEDVTEAIRLDPESDLAFCIRGEVRRERGDLDGSLHDYTEAIRLKPNLARAFHGRGTTRREKGDWEGASQDFSEAVRLGFEE